MRRIGLRDSFQSKNIDVIACGAATTIQTEERLFNRNIVTNESNYQYWQNKFGGEGAVDAGQYDLQRRIDNDLFN